MGAFFQNRASDHEEKLLTEKRIYNRKYNLYSQFTSNFYKKTVLSKNLALLRCKRKIMSINRNDPAYKETLESHKKIADEHRSLDSEFVLLDQVKILYKTRLVTFYVQNLKLTIDTFYSDKRFKNNTLTKDDIDYYFEIILNFYVLLIEEMGKEINGETVI